MSALDKSLDDIIKSSGKKTFKTKKFANKSKPTKVGKSLRSNVKKPVSFKKPAAAVAKPSVDLTYATKVVVHGLPRDLKHDNIKDFFQSQIGGVQNISLNYNEKGQFKGIATIIFKSSKSATLAVEKYNGAPIDGGSSKLKLELIIDPSIKPLTSRIAANKLPTQKTNTKLAAAKKLAVAKKQAAKKQAGKKEQKKPAKRVKKSVEELDQEMADYFETN